MIFDPDSREREARENPDVQRGLEQARRGELTDGPNLDRRNGDERRQDIRRMDDKAMEEVKNLPTVIPNQCLIEEGVRVSKLAEELVALAATIRQCQRTGHPDLSKHLEALLTKLGV
jgi:hypothetical protein